MTRVRARGEDVRKFILERIEKHPADIAKIVSDHFKITRQGAHVHLAKLVKEGALTPEGSSRTHSYRLAPLLDWRETYSVDKDLAEDVVWREDVSKVLGALPDNVLEIWHYCFTEMFNNAIDHSGGTVISIHLSKTAVNTQIGIYDNGVGIFKKIQEALGLLDERHAILELSKGKLTTDPEKHTGQGIFFTSRMLDSFDILSGGVFYSHEFGHEEDWILERQESDSGTGIYMKLGNHTARTFKRIADQYSSEDDIAFTTTVVPVRLAQYGQEKLVSRSQAKRLLARVELFKMVILDFTGVDTIGQGFADEIFRIFVREHPDIEIKTIHANAAVTAMVEAAKNTKSMTLSDVRWRPEKS
jgi:hypothetical protein